MKTFTFIRGFTNQQEAIQYMGSIEGDIVLCDVRHVSGMPVTPIAWVLVTKEESGEIML
jgi:hypothetical protein